MKAKIKIKQAFEIEIDGTLIIEQPPRPPSRFDLLPKMLGGNLPNGSELTFDAEVVRADCGHMGTAQTTEFKRPSATGSKA